MRLTSLNVQNARTDVGRGRRTAVNAGWTWMKFKRSEFECL